MTWTKLGAEFTDECANCDLSDAAFRTHVEAIAYLYKVRVESCRFPKRTIRRFATSDVASDAIKELVDHGWWKDRGKEYEVIHHADVIVDSLAAQQAKKDRDRKAQQARRDRLAKEAAESGVSDDVSADTRQTDRQTKQLGRGVKQTCKHGVPNGAQEEPWSDGLVCADCTREARRA